MNIIKLNRDEYAGRSFVARYTTCSYIDIERTPEGFSLTRRKFDKVCEKSFEDSFFGDWLEDPVAYGAFEDGKMLAFGEGSMETWNNRFRISNICVFDEALKGHGMGTALMETLLCEARQHGARMAVLETQSCNEKAIAFYRKCGFEVIGFDMFAYSNRDRERHEIRLEMGKILNGNA